MNTVVIRQELHEYIEQADDRLLNLIYAMVQADMSEEKYKLSDTHKKILDERIMAHEEDPNSGSSWTEVKSRIKFKK